MDRGVVWLTGCASGVGLHLAQVFGDLGWRVAATDIEGDALREVARERGWDADRVLIRRQDVRDVDQWERVYEELLGRWAQLDLLFNVAGYVRAGWLTRTPGEEMARHMGVNFGGVVHGSLLAARHMQAQGRGHIVNIASLAGVAPIPGLGFYSASKFAVRAFSRALAYELRPAGVYVTVICPDAIETPMLVSEESHEEAALTFSGARPLTVQDMEKAVFDRVLRRRPVELVLPAGRGLQARMAGAFPGLAGLMLERLRRKGLKNQQRRLRARR